MPEYRVEIKVKDRFGGGYDWGLLRDVEALGIKTVSRIEVARAYQVWVDGNVGKVKTLCEALLVDTIKEEYSINPPPQAPREQKKAVEIIYKPGVMDSSEESIKRAMRELGLTGITSVRRIRRYIFWGDVSYGQLDVICHRLLVNPLVEDYDCRKRISLGPVSPIPPSPDLEIKYVSVVDADDKALSQISRRGQLSLDLEEMRKIKEYFRRQGRNPSDVELETIAQSWSEHCCHKTFRGKIRLEREGDARPVKVIDNLLKSTIIRATQELDRPWCVSVFEDNSGIIEFDENYNVCFKVETHNHPSALEPFGGANTGLGGVLRDCLGTGLGARPIANTSIFCFAPASYPGIDIPQGVLSPKRVIRGVVAGVADYGNKMGVPTVHGAVIFEDESLANPLVFCGSVGLIPKGKEKKQAQYLDKIMVVGGRTGRDGIHGATFSSAHLDSRSQQTSSSAVQIGNPITQKKMADVLLAARDKGLYSAITDCGAGGLSSAVGEMAKDLGADVYLEDVPLKYQGLTYREIWISEAQERMVLSVPEKNVQELLDLFKSEDVEARVIGYFRKDKRLRLFYYDRLAADLDVDFLHRGRPELAREAKIIASGGETGAAPSRGQVRDVLSLCKGKCRDLTDDLLRVLADDNISSKEWIIRQYDHEVQGGTILKPLTGANNDGPSDAAVIRPLFSSFKGVAVSCGINPRYGMLSPYWMAASCIEEALRQLVCVGADISRLAILDNFCWGSPEDPEQLGRLVDAAQGCYDFAKYFGLPFISGKDSLYNEYRVEEKARAIPATLLISALGLVPDIRRIVSMDFKQPGNMIYIVGETRDELGGSIYLRQGRLLGDSVPKIDKDSAGKIIERVSSVIRQGLVKAAHDCSQGGLAVALAEMALAGGWGASVSLAAVPCGGEGRGSRDEVMLFSESNTRFILEIEKDKQKALESNLNGVPFAALGTVSRRNRFRIDDTQGRAVVDTDIDTLRQAWKGQGV
ncbi:MAG: phosphoribosylformylglycinamidine synthase subunit PurL [Candidatus Omnitrophota bacterium]